VNGFGRDLGCGRQREKHKGDGEFTHLGKRLSGDQIEIRKFGAAY
jgi:hypothetical protein